MPSTIALQSGPGAGVFLLLAFLMILAHVVLIAWVYADAQANSDDPPFLWALVVFFAPLLGLVLYALLGRDGSRSTRRRTHRR